MACQKENVCSRIFHFPRNHGHSHSLSTKPFQKFSKIFSRLFWPAPFVRFLFLSGSVIFLFALAKAALCGNGGQRIAQLAEYCAQHVQCLVLGRLPMALAAAVMAAVNSQGFSSFALPFRPAVTSARRFLFYPIRPPPVWLLRSAFAVFPSPFILCCLLPRFLPLPCQFPFFFMPSLSRTFARFELFSLPVSFFILSPISPKYANSPFRLYSHLSGPLRRFSPCFAQACPFSFQPLFVSFFQGKPSINTKPPNDGAKDWRANPPCRASVARL